MRTSVVGVSTVMALALSGCKYPDLPPLEPDADLPGADATDADLRVPLMVTVSGEGRVTSDPVGIDCGVTCSSEFDSLTEVTLSGTPDTTAVFEGWSGDCTGTTCSLTMDGPKSVSALFSARGSVRWVKQFNLLGEEFTFETAVDPAGDVVLAGTTTDANDSDLVVVKYRGADGQVAWMKHLDTPNTSGEFFSDVAVDLNGNVYVAARLAGTGTVTYDGYSVSADVFGNALVLRLAAATGAVEWAKGWGGSAADSADAITVEGTDVIVAGSTASNPSTFDGRTITAQSGNGFVVRANATTGIAQQLKLIPGTVTFNAIAVNGADIAVVGSARASASFDTCSVSTSGTGNDALVLDLDAASLACKWERTYGDSTSGNDAHASSVAAFPGGGWALTGYFEGTLWGLTAQSLGSRGMFDVVVARLAADGQTSWAYRYGDAENEMARAVGTTADGGVVVSGDFTGSLGLGTFALSGTFNTFVTRLSPGVTPIHEWAISLGGNDSDSNQDVSLAADGSVFVVSHFVGMTTVGTTALASQGPDIWVAKLVR